MEKLEADFDYSEYCTVYLYCTVFPLEKTQNGYYKCHFCYKEEDKEHPLIWVLPANLIEENGHVEATKDIYFARWLVKEYSDLARDGNGEPIKKGGLYHAISRLKLGRLIEFWNTRVFGEGSEPFKTAKKGK